MKRGALIPASEGNYEFVTRICRHIGQKPSPAYRLAGQRLWPPDQL